MIEVSEFAPYFLRLPEVAAWPTLVEVWDHYAKNPQAWLLPELGCRAVGGDVRAALPVISAVACCHISIVLVDDLLDDDPKGLFQQQGAGETANLSLAFQAAAYRIAQSLDLETAVHTQILSELIHLNLKTAYGQHLDVQKEISEAHYWTTVEAKSVPYYAAGIFLGSLVGGAAFSLAAELRHFGSHIGKLIQISDDLADVFLTPARPDWHRGSGNLAILYARLADHPYRTRFEALLPEVDRLDALEEAQQILLQSGATSYCIYHLLQLAREARALIDASSLAAPELLQQFLAERVAHLFQLMKANGIPLPADLETELLG